MMKKTFLAPPLAFRDYFESCIAIKFYITVAALLILPGPLLLVGISDHGRGQRTAGTPHPSLLTPQSYSYVPSSPGSSSRIIAVPAGGDLQSALDEASPGDEIRLEAGAEFKGNFILPEKEGKKGKKAEWITVRSSADDLPSPGKRITPAQAGLMPKIISPNSDAALRTAPRAHHYRLIGIELSFAPDVTTNYGILLLGSGGGDQDSMDLVPHDLIIDRCYIHGSPTADVSRGIGLNSASTSIIDSYISEIHGDGFETQAIAGWNGPGPYRIVNNYLEAAGVNVMFGGADPSITGLVPSDIEFSRNHCYKPLSWKADEPTYAGRHWTIKNLFELKNARRVTIDGNLFENNWAHAQDGVAIMLTPRNQEDRAPWSVVEDVDFTNNIVRHTASAISILGQDNLHTSQQAKRIWIKNNLFEDVGAERWGGGGTLFYILNAAADVTIENNTAFQTGSIIIADERPSTGLIFNNNLVPHNEYGVFGVGHAPGNDSIEAYFPGGRFKKNAIVGGQSSSYPKKNFFPESFRDVGFIDPTSNNYRLASSSPYKLGGLKGRDIGADIDAIEAATGISISSTRMP